MALEIQEIGIQLQVGNGDEESPQRRQGDPRRPPSTGLDCSDEEQRQAVVNDCVERVLQILERQRQR